VLAGRCRYGLAGAIVNGATRDVTGLAEMSFPTFARGVARHEPAGSIVGANRPSPSTATSWRRVDGCGGRERRRVLPAGARGGGSRRARRLVADENARLAAIRRAPIHRHAALTRRVPDERTAREPAAPVRSPRRSRRFNCANLAPQLRSVRKAGERRSPATRGPGVRLDWFTDVERLRTLFARLVGGCRGVARSYRRPATGWPSPP
jgi:hypothetical protein